MKKKLLLIVFSFVAFSCSNDEEIINADNSVGFSEQNVLDDFLKATKFDKKSVDVNFDYNSEYGMRFKPKVKGVIKSIKVKFPYSDSNVRVTVWEVASQKVLFSGYIEKVRANEVEILNITPCELKRGKEYMISYFNNQYYLKWFDDSGLTHVEYPLQVGKINITGFNVFRTFSMSDNYNLFAMPYCDASGHSQYRGDLDFVFQEIE